MTRQKGIALLAYLAYHREPIARDVLATMLWPESDQSRAKASLRRDLSILNSALGEGWLEIDREVVQLKPSDVDVDVNEFKDTIGRSRTISPNTVKSIDLLQHAADLYTGDFMEGFTLPDSPEFDEWQFFTREALRQDMSLALEQLVNAYYGQTSFEQGLDVARRWLSMDQLNVRAHQIVIELFQQLHQPAAARRQMQLAETIFADELGLTFDEAVQEDPLVIETPAISSSKPLKIELPDLPTPLIGREETLQTVETRLLDPACRLLTLVGPGGSGKTSLAVQAGQNIADRPDHPFQHGVVFVRLGSITTRLQLISAIGAALNLTLDGPLPPDERLSVYLESKSMLLILDNFEQLIQLEDLALFQFYFNSPLSKLFVKNSYHLPSGS